MSARYYQQSILIDGNEFKWYIAITIRTSTKTLTNQAIIEFPYFTLNRDNSYKVKKGSIIQISGAYEPAEPTILFQGHITDIQWNTRGITKMFCRDGSYQCQLTDLGIDKSIPSKTTSEIYDYIVSQVNLAFPNNKIEIMNMSGLDSYGFTFKTVYNTTTLKANALQLLKDQASATGLSHFFIDNTLFITRPHEAINDTIINLDAYKEIKDINIIVRDSIKENVKYIGEGFYIDQSTGMRGSKKVIVNPSGIHSRVFNFNNLGKTTEAKVEEDLRNRLTNFKNEELNIDRLSGSMRTEPDVFLALGTRITINNYPAYAPYANSIEDIEFYIEKRTFIRNKNRLEFLYELQTSFA